MKNVTIKDVAKKANVSITTVSLVLNNKTEYANISNETIDHVKKVAEELHYFKNHMASSLRSKVTKTIGLIVPEINNGYYSRIVDKFDEILVKKSYTLLIAISNNNFEKEMSLFNQMIERHVDYLIYLPSSIALRKENSELLEKTLKQLPIKFVVLDRKTKINHHVEVINDDVCGASLGVEHLIERGYRRIACITGPKGVSSSDDRLKGYCDVLEKHHIPFDEDIIFEGNYGFDKAVEISKKIVARDDIDAVFVFNDLMAYALYFVCDKFGKRVGTDLAVVGFDDNTFSALITPSLTSVGQDIDMICKTAVDCLFDDENERQVIKITPHLAKRKSVGFKNG